MIESSMDVKVPGQRRQQSSDHTREFVVPFIDRELFPAVDDGRLLVSAISVWEVGLLVAKKRLVLNIDVCEWVAEALRAPGVQLVDLTPDIALDSSHLPKMPSGDPADRILIATAQRMAASLMTADREILEYGRRTKSFQTIKAGR